MLKELLLEKKPEIVKRWFEALLETYPEGTRRPLRTQGARFANPVGYNMTEGLDALFDALQAGMLPDTVSVFLDSIVRIRAVQNFPPSQALGFILHLKNIVRGAIAPEMRREAGLAEEFTAWESAVDDLALFSFDLYMQCREKIYDIKAQESTRMNFRLLQQAKIIVEKESKDEG